MDNVQAALDAPTALNVTVQATRRREVRRSSRSREYLTEREIEKLMHATSGNRDPARLPPRAARQRARRLAPGRCRFPDWQAACAALQGRDGQRPPDWWARAPRLAPLAAGGAAGALRVHLRAPGALSVAGYQRMVARAGEAASFPLCCATRAATSWPTMGGTPDRSNTILATGRLLRRFATRRSRRIGSRISGEIEKNAPADANDQI